MENKINICLFTTGVMPVPPVKGGAVENLIKLLLDQNEEEKRVRFTVTSPYDKEALEQSKAYKESSFYFVKPPSLFVAVDRIAYFILQILFGETANSFRKVFERLHYIKKCRNFFLKSDFSFIVAENHITLFSVMKDKRMRSKYEDKFFYHAHNAAGKTFGLKKQFNACKKIICVSEFIKENYKASFPQSKASYYVVKNAVDTNLFAAPVSKEESLELRKEYNIARDDFVIIFSGRIVEGKGVIPLAKAFVSLPVKNKKLIIAGSSFLGTKEKGGTYIQMQQILSPCGKDAIFTGFIDYPLLQKLYAASDVSCFIPLWNEAAGLVNIEAQAAGLPLVTTKTGGISEYCSPKAVLLQNGNLLVEHTVESLVRLYEHPEERKEMSQANRQFAVQFTPQKFYKDFLLALGIEK